MSRTEEQYRSKIICERKLNKKSQSELDAYVKSSGMSYEHIYNHYMHNHSNDYFVNVGLEDVRPERSLFWDDTKECYYGTSRRLTNFYSENLPAYQDAIKAYHQNGGDVNLILTRIAPYYIHDVLHNLNNHCAIWISKDWCDLSSFWRCYEKFEELLYILKIKKRI